MPLLGGTLVLVGGEKGGRWIGALSRTFRGLLLSPFVSQRLRGVIATTKAADLRLLTELIEAGALSPVVARPIS